MSVLVAIVDLFLRNKQYPLQCFSGRTLGPLVPSGDPLPCQSFKGHSVWIF